MQRGYFMASHLLATKIPGLLLTAAILTSLPVLWFFAIPIIDTSGAPAHMDHLATLYLHVIGGVSVIVTGGVALYIGWTRRIFRRHRWFGYAYLALGSMMAVSALTLSIEAPHEPRSLYVATATLAAVWLAVAAMAFRAARNQRFLVHRNWMIRSYVLTWTFVGCRIATNLNLFPTLGAEGATAAIWVNWIIPFVICEIALQWKSGSRTAVQRT